MACRLTGAKPLSEPRTNAEILYDKNACASSLTLIFTMSVDWVKISVKEAIQNVFFYPTLKNKYSQLILSKLSRKSEICRRRSPWLLIVLVHSLMSARLDTARLQWIYIIIVTVVKKNCLVDQIPFLKHQHIKAETK